MPRRPPTVAVAPLVSAFLSASVVGLGLAACGGGDDDARTVTVPAQRPSVGCRGRPLSATGLPESFPDVEGVTFTRTQTAGPTQIVDGYLEGTLREGWQRYKAALRRAGYAVVFDEIEARDSEVAYIGGGRTGQVALRALCREPGRVAVHVTSRPE